MAAALLVTCLVGASCRRSETANARNQPVPPGLGTGAAGREAGTAADVLAEDVLFDDITEESGLQFIHDVGVKTKHFMPASVGSGAALLDFDNDGRLDIYLLQNGGPGSGATNRLFWQDEDGRFTDVSDGSGLEVAGYGMGVAVGDLNNDGAVDVFLTEYDRVRLFENRSTGSTPRFVDVTEAAALENALWGTSTCFFDYGRDGWLDLIVLNYVNYDPDRWCADSSGRQEFCGPDAFNGRRARLFHNLGPQQQHNGKRGATIRFEDVTVSSGFAARPAPGLGVFCADFDGDRWPDVFVANDGKPNHLWMNQRDGSFREEAMERGIGFNSMGRCEADMGVAIGDVNGDANFDLFVGHLSTETHTLWLQEPRGFFEDRTAAAKLGTMAWKGTCFGTAMVDLDNDGSLDLVVTNGRITRAAEHASLWPGLDPFCGNAAVSRGLACGDVDNDGGIDLLVTAIGGPALLFRNVAAGRHHWLLVRAIDPALRRDAYGAEVYVRAGDRRWMRWINPGYSYLCSNDPRAHFGLGSADRVDAIEVVWPDGTEEKFPGTDADRLVVLKRGEGRPVER